MRIDVKTAAALLREKNNVLIICHESPDGDTTGSGFALVHALRAMGKNANVVCSDPFPKSCHYITEGVEHQSFAEEFVVAVDVADAKLIGASLESYRSKVDLCIDHHISNKDYAEKTLLNSDAAATAEIIAELIEELGVTITMEIANCLYTGISTDTGCFRYTNTTARTHMIAAKLIEAGADHGGINHIMFETKSKGRVEMEKQAYNRLEYYFDERCAVVVITLDMLRDMGISAEELEGITSLPRQIEGVQVGVTMRQRPDGGGFKISVRTNDHISASMICGELGGGGHAKASGCSVNGTLEEVKKQILDAVAKYL